MRPDSGDFEDWLTAHRGEHPTPELIETAVNVLSVAERERISGSYAGWSLPQCCLLTRSDRSAGSSFGSPPETTAGHSSIARLAHIVPGTVEFDGLVAA